MSQTQETHDRWSRVKAITATALERPESERSSYVAAACAGDETLIAEVESLLGAHAQAGAFLDSPAVGRTGAAEAIAGAVEPTRIAAVGARIGPYRILSELGRGGMGVVYLAERADAAYEKTVAIKLVGGGFAGEALTQRFREERRILASLDHPNIARLIDGGTTDGGLPYLVMEHVDGVPLDVYVRANGVGVRGRLLLLRQVCAAVQYAHQRLVIHRDLKAGNILVTADGTPKLLDFGIAKLLEPGANAEDQTRTGMRALTLDVASPEQVRGEPLSVTSDVYSLGVLLYRLLTGQGPYGAQKRSEPELIRAICEDEPARPSSVAPGALRGTRGELDWITLAALRKEPERRYPSVAALDADLQRYLEGRPVSAAPDSWAYRAGKYVTRHRGAVAISAVLALTLAAGVGATLWQARRARLEGARAERRANDGRKLANAVVGELHDAIRYLPGATAARTLLVTRALEYLDALARDTGGDESLQRELAAAYGKVGDAQGNPYTENLGDAAAAMRSYQKAFDLQLRLAGAHPDNADLQRELAAAHDRIADMAWAGGDNQAALAGYRRALEIYASLAARDTTAVEDRFEMAHVLNKIGAVQVKIRDLPGALASYGRMRELMSALATVKPRYVPYRRGVVLAAMKSGEIAGMTGDATTASATLAQAERLMRALARENPESADLKRLLALVLTRTGNEHLNRGRTSEAIAAYREALALHQSLVSADPGNIQSRFSVANTYERLGNALSVSGRHEAAATAIRQAIAIGQRAHDDRPGYATGTRMPELYLALGAARAAAGDPAEALSAYRKAVALFEADRRSEEAPQLAKSYAGVAAAQARLAHTRP